MEVAGESGGEGEDGEIRAVHVDWTSLPWFGETEPEGNTQTRLRFKVRLMGKRVLYFWS